MNPTPQQLFEQSHPSNKFVSNDIRMVCYNWWLYTPQGRRVVVFTRSLQGLLHNIMKDYSLEHLVEAIKKYATCIKYSNKYWYGKSNYTLEYFLTAKNGELLTKFTSDPLDMFLKESSSGHALEYK